MNRFLLLLFLMTSFIACSKQNDNTAKQKATNSKEPTIEFFASCDKLYKDPKATQDDIDSCLVGIYEKDPKAVLSGAAFTELEEVVSSYWNQGEGFKAIELLDAINSRGEDENEEDEEEPNLKDLLGNISRAKFELADYYIGKKEYKKAYDLLQELSSIEEDGKADVTYALAYLYFYGLGVDKNEEKAKRILDRLTVNDRVRWGTSKYIVYDINFLREGADKNDSFSHYLLAQIYERGRVTLSMTNGCRLAYDELNKAIQNGYAPAMHYLARFYWDDSQLACGYELGEDHWGIFDSRKALELYTTAANKGYVPSQIVLGNVYSLGSLGTETDPKLSFQWYSKAAESNDPDALYALISVYYNGEGTPVNYKKAFDYAQRIKDVEPSALVWLGKMYFYGKGTKQDYKKAFEVLNQWKSVDGEHFNNRYNYENAYYLLGLMYQNGLGTKQDLEKAKEYFKDIGKDYLMATDDTYPVEFLLRNFVENNNPQAQEALGKKDLQEPTKTILEYAKKAYAGDPAAMYKLGAFLEENKFDSNSMFYPKGTKDDKTDCTGAFETEAYKWIKKAAELGNADAQFMLGEAYETGVIPRGTAWWYGHCMTEPIVISKDEATAKERNKKAAKQGHSKAKEKIGQ